MSQGGVLPEYPYDRVKELVVLADRLDGGAVDCSVGSPLDPALPAVLAALAASRGTERGYPPAVGMPEFRLAATRWIARRLRVELEPDVIAACVGTKELVASTPGFLHLREPSRDTVLYPEPSYPTYAMGAHLAGLRPVAVPAGPKGLSLDAIAQSDAARALCLWVNSPANPTGVLEDLDAAASWGREHGVPVLSDECYVEFTWSDEPATILSTGLDGVLAVHSLSKRSNLAGLRAGFIAGDPELVSFLAEARRHAGLLVPGPVQLAATVALADDEHVVVQRSRYRQRLERTREILRVVGLESPMPAGGIYLWVDVSGTAVPKEPVPPEVAGRGIASPAWAWASWLAAAGGLVTSPGELYGSAGEGFLRIAMVQPLERLEVVFARLQRYRR